MHLWNLAVAEAIALQAELAGRVDTTTPLTHWETVAGADIAYAPDDSAVFAGVVVWRVADGVLVDSAVATCGPAAAYVPSLFSFREAPPLLQAFAALKVRPDVVICDGHGRAHPRRFGLACHLGLWLDLPCLGCGKTHLYGDHVLPGPAVGDKADLCDPATGEALGVVLRSRAGVKPVYVSPGHRIDTASAAKVVQSCCRGVRLPEPIRLAHQLVNAERARALTPP